MGSNPQTSKKNQKNVFLGCIFSAGVNLPINTSSCTILIVPHWSFFLFLLSCSNVDKSCTASLSPLSFIQQLQALVKGKKPSLKAHSLIHKRIIPLIVITPTVSCGQAAVVLISLGCHAPSSLLRNEGLKDQNKETSQYS